MSDMLVRLYDLQEDKSLFDKLASEGISIKRALPPDRYEILEFIKKNFTAGKAWAGECEVALSRIPVSCYIAVKNKEIVGFGCYDATAKGYFGPTGVIESCRNKGIGKALLVKCLVSMREDGYGYGIIGWPETHAVKFYEKAVGAIVIEDSTNGIYKRMIEN
jgi:ribosomal protein S18 acetylase RimI-like enzyme